MSLLLFDDIIVLILVENNFNLGGEKSFGLERLGL